MNDHPNAAPRVRVASYRPAWREAFAAISREWIEGRFGLEPADERVLADPEAEILAPGGAIFFVLEDDVPVGTVALIRADADSFELAKMGVRPASQGRGHGHLLVRACLDHARAAGARRVFLLSNRTLTAALRLYERHGFRTVPFDSLGCHGEYRRCDVAMELWLEDSGERSAAAPPAARG